MTGKPLPFIESLSKTNRAIVTAYRKGYRVIDGVPYNPEGQRLKIGYQDQRMYRRQRFSVKVGKETCHTYIHKLVAFQKYGYEMFAPGIQVRHLDGNSENNLPENIAIGTASENMMDKSPEDRARCAVNASNSIRKFNNAQIEKIRALHKSGWPYSRLMAKFGIKSKGTMHHIINNDYVTEKTG